MNNNKEQIDDIKERIKKLDVHDITSLYQWFLSYVFSFPGVMEYVTDRLDAMKSDKNG